MKSVQRTRALMAAACVCALAGIVNHISGNTLIPSFNQLDYGLLSLAFAFGAQAIP